MVRKIRVGGIYEALVDQPGTMTSTVVKGTRLKCVSATPNSYLTTKDKTKYEFIVTTPNNRTFFQSDAFDWLHKQIRRVRCAKNVINF